MERIKRFQIRGVPQSVERFDFDGRTVDLWSPGVPTKHLLIAHDGQNVLKRSPAAGRRSWRMAQSAIKVGRELGITPPAIIAVFHSRSPENPWGRILDLAPQDPFQNGVTAASEANDEISLEDLQGNRYLEEITDVITPAICDEMGLDLSELNKAVVGSSMGGLASLYALSKRPDFFTTSLALSPHWLAGEEPLVDALLASFPKPGMHKVWMSHGTGGYDAKYGPFQRYADQKMRDAGWQEDFVTRVYNRSGHNERSWAKYLVDPLRFWLSPRK
ncbi:MAG: alpha/beta hydrolase-fold protein [Candidatus Nanopelagicaceae bacterium]|nr:alpha/beta hydrolase-fold protein [Candidatus Nanopelagicaceae bacterium]